MRGILTLAGAVLLTTMTAATASEPVDLSDAQLDEVTAGGADFTVLVPYPAGTGADHVDTSTTVAPDLVRIVFPSQHPGRV